MPKKITTKEFIEKAKEISDKDTFENVNYINSETKVEINCKIHGVYLIRPADFLQGHRCPKCGGTLKLTKEEFAEKAKQVHRNKYDYSKVEYINNKTKVCIICPIHGEFWQKPNYHLNGNGCPKCAGQNKTTEDFIKEAKKIHNDKYNYSKVNYKDAITKVCIICPEHGEFWQTPNNHLNGNGCPNCSNVIKESKMSQGIYAELKKYFLNIEKEKTFPWLHHKRSLKIDFYLPDYKIGVEVQGQQHFEMSKKFGGKKEFFKQVERDRKKQILCENNGVKLFYITRKKYNIDEILNYINETTNKGKNSKTD